MSLDFPKTLYTIVICEASDNFLSTEEFLFPSGWGGWWQEVTKEGRKGAVS